MFHLPPNKSQNCRPSYLKIQFSICSIPFLIKCRKWNLLRIQFYSRDDNLASMRNFLWLTQWFTGKIQPNANYIPAPFLEPTFFFQTQNFFGPKFYLTQNTFQIFLDSKFFGPQFSEHKFFWTQHSFGSKNFFGKNIFLNPKTFLSPKLF